MIEFDMESIVTRPIACIKVLGVGGGGGNTVNSMINANFTDITFIAANTDAQALSFSQAQHKIQLGAKSTKGLGTGADPELGKKAAEEDLSKVMDYLEDADIVFLTGGMGGGTGSGGLPVIARALREKNILTIAVLTKPFLFEGKKRAQVAQNAIDLLKKEVDTLVVIPNQNLLDTVDHSVSMVEAFALINNILMQSVKGISDIIAKPGHINVDFADVKTIMKGMGLAIMGTGRATGKDRACQAALQAISSPLLENMDIKGARSLLINISGNESLSLFEIADAAQLVTEHADPQANIIVGSVIDNNLHDDVMITVIATGFDRAGDVKQATQEQLATSVHSRSQQLFELHKKATELSSIFNHNNQAEKNAQQYTEQQVSSTILDESKKELYQPSTAQGIDFDVPSFLRKPKAEQNTNKR